MAQSGDLGGSLDLLLAILVSEHLLADGAGPVSFRTVLGAGCGNRVDLGQLVGSQRQILDLSGIAVLIHNSAALAALVVGFPALFHAGRLLCGNRNGGVLVGRHLHSHRAGSSLAASGSGDSGGTSLDGGNFTVRTDGDNIAALCDLPGHSLVSSLIRLDSRSQLKLLAHFQIQGLGRDGNGSDSNRLGLQRNGAIDSLAGNFVAIFIHHVIGINHNSNRIGLRLCSGQHLKCQCSKSACKSAIALHKIIAKRNRERACRCNLFGRTAVRISLGIERYTRQFQCGIIPFYGELTSNHAGVLGNINLKRDSLTNDLLQFVSTAFQCKLICCKSIHAQQRDKHNYTQKQRNNPFFHSFIPPLIITKNMQPIRRPNLPDNASKSNSL